MLIGGKRIFSVSELTGEIKSLLERNFYYVWVEGEVSDFRTAQSGHSYFILKDKDAQLKVVLFRNRTSSLKFTPSGGDSLVCRGAVGVYAARGDYQLTADLVEPAGLGVRHLAFEQLKKRLAGKGFFDPEKKKPLPLLPRRVGVVTSPSGAAVRDILNVLKRRFPGLDIVIFPVRVQGVSSSNEIAEGVSQLNSIGNIDVIIVARGGGSVEDLWAFNEEVVAESIYNSSVPVISAVGHETDYTLSDMVADLRVPTPSAAAELVVRSRDEFMMRIESLTYRLSASIKGLLEHGRADLRQMEKGLSDPRKRLEDFRQRLDDTSGRLEQSLYRIFLSSRKDIAYTAYRLEALSPLKVLSRGYSIVRKIPGFSVVSDAGGVSVGDRVNVLLHKGELRCKVYEKNQL